MTEMRNDSQPDLMEPIRSRRGLMSALAKHLGVWPAAVSRWRSVPAKHVEAVSRYTGIAPHVLAPHIFSAPLTNQLEKDV